MRRLRRELELAAAREVAVDRLVAHDALDRVDRRRRTRGTSARARSNPTLRGHLGDSLTARPLLHWPPLRPEALGRDTLPRLEDDHRGAALRQRQRRRQAREAAADDRDVALRRQIGRARHEGRRAVSVQ